MVLSPHWPDSIPLPSNPFLREDMRSCLREFFADEDSECDPLWHFHASGSDLGTRIEDEHGGIWKCVQTGPFGVRVWESLIEQHLGVVTGWVCEGSEAHDYE